MMGPSLDPIGRAQRTRRICIRPTSYPDTLSIPHNIIFLVFISSNIQTQTNLDPSRCRYDMDQIKYDPGPGLVWVEVGWVQPNIW